LRALGGGGGGDGCGCGCSGSCCGGNACCCVVSLHMCKFCRHTVSVDCRTYHVRSPFRRCARAPATRGGQAPGATRSTAPATYRARLVRCASTITGRRALRPTAQARAWMASAARRCGCATKRTQCATTAGSRAASPRVRSSACGSLLHCRFRRKYHTVPHTCFAVTPL
jgi:hypothetical protein